MGNQQVLQNRIRKQKTEKVQISGDHGTRQAGQGGLRETMI
jgi:hypothetical protein